MPEGARGASPLGQWPHNLSATLACLGCTVGLFNISRFAVLSVQFGANFIIQFLLLSAVFGVPLYTFQVCLGQYLAAGAVDMWRISPVFQGIGIALLASQALIGVYSTVGVSWIFIYFRDSFITKQDRYRWAEPFDLYREDQRLYYNATPHLEHTVPDYLNGVVLQRHNLAQPENSFGHIKFQVAFNLAVVWMIVFVSLSKGLRSYGKVVYVFSVVPVFGMLVLCTKMLGLMPRDSNHQVFPETEWTDFFTNSECWVSATTEVFLTWGLLGTAAMQIASHNKQKKYLQRDSSLVIVFTVSMLLLAAFLANMCVALLKANGFNCVPSSFAHVDVPVPAAHGAGPVPGAVAVRQHAARQDVPRVLRDGRPGAAARLQHGAGERLPGAAAGHRAGARHAGAAGRRPGLALLGRALLLRAHPVRHRAAAGHLALRHHRHHGHQRVHPQVLGDHHHLLLVRVRLHPRPAHDHRAGHLRGVLPGLLRGQRLVDHGAAAAAGRRRAHGARQAVQRREHRRHAVPQDHVVPHHLGRAHAHLHLERHPARHPDGGVHHGVQEGRLQGAVLVARRPGLRLLAAVDARAGRHVPAAAAAHRARRGPHTDVPLPLRRPARHLRPHPAAVPPPGGRRRHRARPVHADGRPGRGRRGRHQRLRREPRHRGPAAQVHAAAVLHHGHRRKDRQDAAAELPTQRAPHPAGREQCGRGRPGRHVRVGRRRRARGPGGRGLRAARAGPRAVAGAARLRRRAGGDQPGVAARRDHHAQRRGRGGRGARAALGLTVAVAGARARAAGAAHGVVPAAVGAVHQPPPEEQLVADDGGRRGQRAAQQRAPAPGRGRRRGRRGHAHAEHVRDADAAVAAPAARRHRGARRRRTLQRHRHPLPRGRRRRRGRGRTHPRQQPQAVVRAQLQLRRQRRGRRGGVRGKLGGAGGARRRRGPRGGLGRQHGVASLQGAPAAGKSQQRHEWRWRFPCHCRAPCCRLLTCIFQLL